MTSISTKYTKFLTDVQANIAKRGYAITERLLSGDSFDEILEEMYVMRDLIQENENYFITDYHIKDNSGTQQYSHIRNCITNDYLLEADMHRIYKKYKINSYAGLLYPLSPVFFLINGSCGSCGIPSGGGPGYYLTKDEEGNLIWSQIDGYRFRKEFVYTDGPQSFFLGVNANRIDLVFVNGQLIPEFTYEYDVDTNILTLLPPIVLSNDSPRITVYAGLGTLDSIVIADVGFKQIKNSAGVVQFTSTTDSSIIFEGTGGISVLFDALTNKITISSTGGPDGFIKESFIWTSGNPGFILNNPASSIFLLFINGQFQNELDYNHTVDTNLVTINNTLEENYEVVIIYKQSVL